MSEDSLSKCFIDKLLEEVNQKYVYIDLKSDMNYSTEVEEVRSEYYDIEYINNLVKKVKNGENNIKRIIIDLPDKIIPREELNNIEDKDMVLFGSQAVVNILTVDEMIKVDETLDMFVKDIRESNLSPYEKYIAVYNIVKSFKQYSFYLYDEIVDEKISDQSRKIYLILFNDWIVCSGYAKLLEELLNRVGIKNRYWVVQSNDCDESHARNVVNLVDSKYGINGYYMCDVTWDNTLENVLDRNYNYLNMTLEEAKADSRFAENLGNGKGTLNIELFNNYTDKEFLIYISDINNLLEMFDILSKLDKRILNKVMKYYEENGIDFELAKYINSYLKQKIKQPISKDITYKAIDEIKKFVYVDEYNTSLCAKKL